MAALPLPAVTLCAITSVNVAATVAALRASLEQVGSAECLLFTDADITPSTSGIRIVRVPRLTSSKAYSHFVLHSLADHIRTSHCLIVQWDGFVLDGARWDNKFLDFDYIGSPWPQFADEHSVGNGGFSLRSRRLLEACRDPRFSGTHPEDVMICRTNRTLLEREHGIRFADLPTAERFSYERTSPPCPTFGFHGIFNMIPALGADRFWATYLTLDDRSTAAIDRRTLLRQLKNGPQSVRRRARLINDLLRDKLKSR
jgi:hypothetical protein